CRLGDWPTPLERAAALGGAVGIVELTVKREDRSSARYGGNKVRALEFLLAGARPGTVFVTLGGTGSTHCLATAVHAAAAGGRVAPRIVANRWRTMWLAYAARRLLAHRGVPLPAPRSLDIVDGLGEGYGHPTPEGEAAERLASEHGLTLDPTYGAKAFAFLLQRGSCNVQRVVFWHTFAVPVPQPERAP